MCRGAARFLVNRFVLQNSKKFEFFFFLARYNLNMLKVSAAICVIRFAMISVIILSVPSGASPNIPVVK